MKKGWTQIQCVGCSGHGLVSAYSAGGADFEGAAECHECNGSGVNWRSPKGAVAQYPGGPFIGREKASA